MTPDGLGKRIFGEIVVLETPELTVFSDGTIQMMVNNSLTRFSPAQVRASAESLAEQLSKLSTIRAAGQMLAEKAEVLIESQDEESEVSTDEAQRYLVAAIENWERVWCGFNN